jgi:hypothetical protein
MPNYPYINYSWGTDAIIYLFYSHFGLWGVSLFTAFVFTIAFLLLTMSHLPLKISKTLLLIPLLIPIVFPSVGVRTQVFTFLGISLVLLLIDLPRLAKLSLQPKPSSVQFTNYFIKSRLWLLPVVFLFWSNLHSGFALGLSIVMFFTIYSCLALKPVFRHPLSLVLIITSLLSLLATLVNPYTYHLHQFILQMTTNTVAPLYNLDWAPFLSNPTFTHTYQAVIVLCFIINTPLLLKRRDLLLLNLVFFALTLHSSRYLLPFVALTVFSATPKIFEAINSLRTKYKLTGYHLVLLYLLFPMIVLSAVSLYLKQTYSASTSPVSYAKQGLLGIHYPLNATNYLKTHPELHRIFNHYNWGGYLIWQLPGRKFYIDGRMDNFFKNGQSFLLEYITIISAKPGWTTLFNQYQPDSVLGYPTWPLITQLLNTNQWQPAYQDSNSILLIKK